MSDILEPYMSNSNPTLAHHGVLGMKWGQHLKKAYVDRYISSSKNNERMIKSFAKQDSDYYKRNSSNKYSKDLAAIGAKDWANKLKNEKIFQTKVSSIDTTKNSYKQVHALIKKYEFEHLELNKQSTTEYETRINNLAKTASTK